MFARLSRDPVSLAILRVVILMLVVIVAGFVAAALGVDGIDMSTTAGALVGGIAAVSITLAARNAQLKRHEDTANGDDHRDAHPGDAR
ncbi:hypothetical protein [Demequina aurantiaca]|uniref:hypothetical protein n=1 Tax=Demequina aurantiaca TaxID=676200 RepID=UPI003D34ECBD